MRDFYIKLSSRRTSPHGEDAVAAAAIAEVHRFPSRRHRHHRRPPWPPIPPLALPPDLAGGRVRVSLLPLGRPLTAASAGSLPGHRRWDRQERESERETERERERRNWESDRAREREKDIWIRTGAETRRIWIRHALIGSSRYRCLFLKKNRHL